MSTAKRIDSKNVKSSRKRKYIFADIGFDFLGKKIKKGISKFTDSEITLTNNEVKGTIKVIKYLENRGIY